MSASEAARPITVLVADDHTVLRSGLHMLLEAEEDLHVVAEAGNILDVFRNVRVEWPQVVVLDLNMPGGSSIDTISQLKRMAPNTAVVVLTMEHEPSFIRAAFDAGASNYVLKEAAATELVDAIRAAVASPRP